MSAIRAAVNTVNFNLSAIRTASSDPNSTKVFCEAYLELTIPSKIHQDTNHTLNKIGFKGGMVGFLEKSGYRQSDTAADVFQMNVEYNLQPTDNGKEVFASIHNHEYIEPISALIALSLSKNYIDKWFGLDSSQNQLNDLDDLQTRIREQAQNVDVSETNTSSIDDTPSHSDTSSNDTQTEELSQEELKTQLNEVKQEYKQAVAQINQTWERLDFGTQEAHKEEQVLFNTEREASCEKQSLGIDGGELEKEIYRYQCAIEKLNERNEELMSLGSH